MKIILPYNIVEEHMENQGFFSAVFYSENSFRRESKKVLFFLFHRKVHSAAVYIGNENIVEALSTEGKIVCSRSVECEEVIGIRKFVN